MIHICPICQKQYEKRNGLLTHCQRVHKKSLSVIFAEQNNEELLECEICRFKTFNLNSHITKTHKLTTKEYRNLYPSAILFKFSDQQHENILLNWSLKDTKKKQRNLESQQKKNEILSTGGSLLKCQICGFESTNSLISHICRKHKLTTEQYKSQFPNSCLQRFTTQQRQKISKSISDKLVDPINRQKFLEWRSFPSEIKHWTRKGFSFEDAKQKVFEFQRKQSLKGNNERTIRKRSLKNSGVGNPMSLESIAKRENIDINDASKFTPCFGRIGEKHPMFGKKHSEQALEKISNAHHLVRPTYRSKLEIEVENFCKSLDEVKHNVGIQRWNVDVLFVNKKIVVEFFGDYWHMNPQKFDSNAQHNITKLIAKDVWARDQQKINILKGLGYNVIVIWETDWRKNKSSCMSMITNVFNQSTFNQE